MKHLPRKRFGQHFLTDGGIIDAIVAAIAPHPGDPMVEIGPGLAALTQPLVERLGRLTVIELDRDLAARLRQHGQLQVIESDVLKVDFSQVAQALNATKLRVVGNLPYNISTPLLFRLLNQRAAISDMYFMLQKEVVDRMAAQPGTKDYGRLTVMLACVAEVEGLFDVGPGAFQPRPKVWSAIVHLRPTQSPRFDIGHEGVLRTLVTAAFSHRRKTLRNSLKGLLAAQDIESCGIDPQLRPETLAPAQFGLLAAHYSRLVGYT